MHFFTTVLHIVLCITLILIILLQPGKGAGSVFGGGGGGGNQMYGPRGQGHFLGKATTVIAATFMFTSITLAFYSRPSEDASDETLKAIREIEQAGTEVVAESNSDKQYQEQLNTEMQDIRDIAAQEASSSSSSSDGESDGADPNPIEEEGSD